MIELGVEVNSLQCIDLDSPSPDTRHTKVVP